MANAATLREAFRAPAYVGGNPAPPELLVWAFRFHRAWLAPAGKVRFPQHADNAARALAKAREDVAAGKVRFPACRYGYNPASPGGLRWVEQPGSNGLRFVGWCDELSHGIKHSGWWCDEQGASTLRGAVFQLPARSGRPVYISGYVSSDESPEQGARLDFSRVTFGDNGEDDDAKREAARYADSLAESAAEDESAHDAAWRGGQEARDAADAAKEARAELLAFLRALKPKKAAFCDSPALIEAAREKVTALLESIAGFRAERDRLADEFRHNREAFNEGYGSA